MDFEDQIKHPKWQKKRLQVLERDDFTCQKCFGSEETLHIHHKYYLKNHKIWEYSLDAFVTLCKTCHEEEREYSKKHCDTLIMAMKEKFLITEIYQLALAINETELTHVPEVFMSAFCWAITNKKFQKEVIRKYFNSLSKCNAKAIHPLSR